MLGAIADILKSRSSEGWLVGGSVRDRLLGRYSPDLDVVVADDPSEVARQLARFLHAPCFALSERYPTFRVLSPEGHVDVTAVRGGGILADLAERDFTVNAMAVPLGEEHLIDPFGGAGHLEEGRLVAVSDRIFADDPLRLMRAARFCHTLRLVPDPEFAGMIRPQATLLPAAAAERVMSEMAITLAAGRTADVAALWADLKLLPVMLPELQQTGAGPDPALLQALDDLLDRPREWFSAEAAGLLEERMEQPVDGSVARPVALRLAALVQGAGVDTVHALGRRLKLSGALLSLLTAASRCSAAARGYAPTGSASMMDELLPDGTTVSRPAVLYLWNAAPWEPEVVLLATAGVAAGARAAASRLMDLAAGRARGVTPPPVDGDDLMRELGLESGPALGAVVREVRLAWEAREATSRSEALEVARRAAARA